MKSILVTGANGFIGLAVCDKLSRNNRVVALDICIGSPSNDAWTSITGDITDGAFIRIICSQYKFDAIVHCAGIAHQKAWQVDKNSYQKINSDAVHQLAEAAGRSNPKVYFIFLSSISVYGENYTNGAITEEALCYPTSEYASSKLSAEKYLTALFKHDVIRYVDIIRLSPVYNVNNSFNIDKRVLAPWKFAYILAGKGNQKMSVLALGNLADFIQFRIDCLEQNQVAQQAFCQIYNICDKTPYSFKQIIEIFSQSQYQPDRFVIRIPLACIRLLLRTAGILMPQKRQWFQAAEKKISMDLVFDNQKMLKTGFLPKYDLSTTYLDKTPL